MCFLDTFNSHHLLSVLPTPVTFSCESFNTAWEPCQDETSRTAAPILQESITEFAIKAFSHLRESQPSSNLLFSPISISVILTHLLLGMKPPPPVKDEFKITFTGQSQLHCVLCLIEGSCWNFFPGLFLNFYYRERICKKKYTHTHMHITYITYNIHTYITWK